MRATGELNKRLRSVKQLAEGTVDCVLESLTNVQRGEWDFAVTNLRMLFRDAAKMVRQRTAVLRRLRLARKEVER